LLWFILTLLLSCKLIKNASLTGRTTTAKALHGTWRGSRSGSRHKVLSDLCHFSFLQSLGLLLHCCTSSIFLGLFECQMNFFLVRVHEKVCSNTGESGFFLVSTRRQYFIKRKDQIKGVFVDGMFLHATHHVWDDLGEETEGSQIFDDIAGFGGDQQEEEIVFQGLIDVSDAVSFHICVLFGVTDQFGKGSQETFDAQTIHFDKLPRDEGLALPSADRSR
jgi:hypothetical protein